MIKTDQYWHQIRGKAEAAEAMVDQCESIENLQQEVHEHNLFHARLYANREMLGLDWQSSTRSAFSTHRWVTENVTQSAVDTGQALIAKQRPRCAVLTDNADHKTARQAKQLDQFLYADMTRAGAYTVGPDVFRDCEIFGTGMWKVYQDGKRVVHERTCPDEIIVDERECISDRQPTMMYHRRPVAISILKAKFGLNDLDIAKIRGEDGGGATWTNYRTVPDNMAVVVEGWYVDRENEKGRRILAVKGKCLVDEEYKYRDFPFAEIRWCDPLSGFYGQSLVFQGAGIQLNINKLNRHIDECLNLLSHPKILCPAGSRIKPTDFTDRNGDILMYTGQQKPDIWIGRAVGPEIFERLQSLKQSYYELAGISMLSATSKKPAGLESGAALREYNDRETDRFAIPSQKYEDLFMRVGRLHIRAAKELGKDYKTRGRSWTDGNLMREIKWKDVDLEYDRFEISIEAASILSKTPAGRKSDVMDLINVGFITPDQAPALLGNPDVARWREMEDADREDAMATIAQLMDGEEVVPDENQNLMLCAASVQRAWLQARNREGTPEEILTNMIEYVRRARELIAKKQEAEMNKAMEMQQRQQTAVQPPPAQGPNQG